MAEKNIIAFFKSPEQAQGALEQLKQLQLLSSSIDRLNSYGSDGIDQIENPLTGDFPGLAYLTLDGQHSELDAAVLQTSSVSASGMSAGYPPDDVSGRDIVLTAIMDDADYEQALSIVQNCGALV